MVYYKADLVRFWLIFSKDMRVSSPWGTREEWIGISDSEKAVSPQWYNAILRSTLKWGNGLLGSFQPCQNKTKSFRFDGVMKLFPDSKGTMSSWHDAKTDSVGLEVLYIYPHIRMTNKFDF